MNNFDNFADVDKINSQLKRAEIQKSRLIQNIYREYELYLNLLRDLLSSSVEKGFSELFSYQSIKDNSLNVNAFLCLFQRKISNLIYTNLPLLTVEQLKINKIEKIINKDINFNQLLSSTNTKNDQIEKYQNKEGSLFEESMHFQISEDISNTSEYYQAENLEKFVSLNLDKNYHNNYFSHNNIFENIGLEKQFISSLLELIDEVRVGKTIYSEKENISEIDILKKYDSLKIFDLIDKSLENLLLNLSYKINQELFEANLIKKMISKDSFEYLVGKKLMIKHPQPFVINFDINTDQILSNGENLPDVIFFNISTVEMEFKNLNLSIQRNKINEQKNQFQRLIKKETYWRQKEITLNKIH